MALSLGSGRRRCACRAVRRGGHGAAGCRHLYVHYHFPRQVCAFSSLGWPFRFSRLPYLLILPVLFFAVLAILVCFGWFTLVYFVSSLLRKVNKYECLQISREAYQPFCKDGFLGNEAQERNKQGRAARHVTERSGVSCMAEICVERQQIKEVIVDEFSNESVDTSRFVLRDDCTDNEEKACYEKLVEEVMIFETNCKELTEISELDVSSEKQQFQGTPIDVSSELSALCDTAKLYHVRSCEDFVANRKEVSGHAWSQMIELIDKHENGEVLVTSSDDSICDGLGDEEKKEIIQDKNVKGVTLLPNDTFANNLPEDIFDEPQDREMMITDQNKKLHEDDIMKENGMQIFCLSDETHDCNNDTETSALSPDSSCENRYSMAAVSNASFHRTNSDEDGQEELAENNGAEASGTTSLVCDFTDNNLAMREEIGVSPNQNISEVASMETSISEMTEDDDEINCTAEGASRRLPLVRRSPPPWWNLCGVLDVFAGCKD